MSEEKNKSHLIKKILYITITKYCSTTITRHNSLIIIIIIRCAGADEFMTDVRTICISRDVDVYPIQSLI